MKLKIAFIIYLIAFIGCICTWSSTRVLQDDIWDVTIDPSLPGWYAEEEEFSHYWKIEIDSTISCLEGGHTWLFPHYTCFCCFHEVVENIKVAVDPPEPVEDVYFTTEDEVRLKSGRYPNSVGWYWVKLPALYSNKTTTIRMYYNRKELQP